MHFSGYLFLRLPCFSSTYFSHMQLLVRIFFVHAFFRSLIFFVYPILHLALFRVSTFSSKYFNSESHLFCVSIHVQGPILLKMNRRVRLSFGR